MAHSYKQAGRVVNLQPVYAAGTRTGSLSRQFPSQAIVGSLAMLAHALACGTEVPEEFYFASALTIFGLICASGLRIQAGLEVEPRLYTVLLGESYAVKKTTAIKTTVQFFEDFVPGSQWKVQYGVGSAEGLARELRKHPHFLLVYDEMRAFVDKCNVQNSALLPMTASLFEVRNWDNSTKQSTQAVSVRDAHLSILGACTMDTYSSMWTNSAIAIGFPNRLFVVSADRKRKVAWPEAPNPETITTIRRALQEQLSRLPLRIGITPEAKACWEDWYNSLPASEHSKRLDTIGFRLLGLIALTTDKDEIDVETVETVRLILEYELNIRTATDPIDADNTIAKLEQSIRRVLASGSGMSFRDLRRRVHADRYGIWAFKRALENLEQVGDITSTDGTYRAVMGA
jgi:hypothetical protein